MPGFGPHVAYMRGYHHNLRRKQAHGLCVLENLGCWPLVFQTSSGILLSKLPCSVNRNFGNKLLDIQMVAILNMELLSISVCVKIKSLRMSCRGLCPVHKTVLELYVQLALVHFPHGPLLLQRGLLSTQASAKPLCLVQHTIPNDLIQCAQGSLPV